jgi:osmotically-inducible protein OsmY
MSEFCLRPLALCGLLFAGIALTGCIEAAVGGGAAVGTTALQERGVKGAATDTAIRAEINHNWLDKDHRLFIDLNLQIHEGRVLVSGVVKDPDVRAEAIQLVWKANGVREVINEVEVIPDGTGIVDYARDTAITTELKSRLLFAKEIQSVNYSVEAVNGSVYLIGVAQSQTELERVLNVARNIRNVKRVVSHVLMKDDPRRFRAPGTTTTTTTAPAAQTTTTGAPGATSTAVGTRIESRPLRQ